MGPSAIREICTIIFIDFDGLFKKYEEIRDRYRKNPNKKYWINDNFGNGMSFGILEFNVTSA